MPLNTAALLGWCQRETNTYDGVSLENWSRSWNDGLAFCALLHRHFPQDIGRFNSLDGATPVSRARNFELAFGVAERRLEVDRLFDVEDMMATYPRPDARSVTTYVVLLYNAIEERDLIVAAAPAAAVSLEVAGQKYRREPTEGDEVSRTPKLAPVSTPSTHTVAKTASPASKRCRPAPPAGRASLQLPTAPARETAQATAGLKPALVPASAPAPARQIVALRETPMKAVHIGGGCAPALARARAATKAVKGRACDGYQDSEAPAAAGANQGRALQMQLTPLPLPDMRRSSEEDRKLSPAEFAMIRKCNEKMEALNTRLQDSPRSRVPTAEEQAMLLSMAVLNNALESDPRNPITIANPRRA